MSAYLVLARKYRPRTFEEVIGQESVTRVLTGAIEEGRVGHAYLFAGPRGTGKTTIARILARALNCEQGPTAKPCGTCERCAAADEGSEVDVIELDAASHTGVDTIRELRDEVVYAPMRARRKVYIVDEVHMLSKAAFNALLKTLEEPPPHVVFLFATTEPHKVLDTILSRCQVLRLSSLSEERIGQRLTDVFGMEGVEPGEGVVEELARLARGGMRDALSLADKLLALAGTTPTLDDLLRLGGETGGRRIEALLSAIEAGDRSACLTQMMEVRSDDESLVLGLLECLRTSLVLLHCGAKAPFVSVGVEERREALERAERLGAERLELLMAELLRARERMRQVPDQSGLVLESTLLDLCREEATLPLADLLGRLEQLERRLLEGAPVAPSRGPVAAQAAPVSAPPKAAPPRDAPAGRGEIQPEPRPAPPPAREPAARATPPAAGRPSAGDLATQFEAFLGELRGTHAALAELLGRARPGDLSESGGEVHIPLGALGDKDQRLAKDRRNRSACSKAFSRVTGRELTVVLDYTGAPSSSGASGDGPVSPEGRGSQRGAGAAQTADPTPPRRPAPPAGDAFTEQVSDLFGGVIEDLS